jgi:hypothetical protein
MNENIFLIRRVFARRRDKAKALLVGKPFDCPLDPGHDNTSEEEKRREIMRG